MYWVKNTKNEPSASLTFLFVAFIVVMVWMTLSIFVNPFGIQTKPFDASEAMIVLTPLLATYFGRRYTDSTTAGLSEPNVGSTKKNKSKTEE